MEPNQVRLIASAVPCDSQQIIYALEPGFAGQIVRDFGKGNRRNRIHDDVAVVHPVATTDLDVRIRPDANAASDPSPPNSFAKVFGEEHSGLRRTRVDWQPRA